MDYTRATGGYTLLVRFSQLQSRPEATGRGYMENGDGLGSEGKRGWLLFYQSGKRSFQMSSSAAGKSMSVGKWVISPVPLWPPAWMLACASESLLLVCCS